MSNKFHDIAFTESVKRAQTHYGSRRHYAKTESGKAVNFLLSDAEIDFIENADSFYLATVGEQNQPYVQFRGGRRGFLKVLDEETLGFADFRGNLQYISVGNLQKNKKAALFLMDYANQRRLKILAEIEIKDASEVPELIEKLRDTDYAAKVERAFILHVEAFDWNCPQHITPRYTIDEVKALVQPMNDHIKRLEKEIEDLKKKGGSLRVSKERGLPGARFRFGEEIMKEYIDKSMTYAEYIKLIDDLLLDGKTTGPNQSEAMFGYGKLNRQRMHRLEKTVLLNESLREIAQNNKRKMIWLIITEGWCGDAAQNIPVIEKIAAESDAIETRYVLRDETLSLMDAYLTNNARSIPKLIALDAETLEEIGTWGPRPQSAMNLFLEMREQGLAKPLMMENLQRWYNTDKNQAIQNEFQKLLHEWAKEKETAAATQ